MKEKEKVFIRLMKKESNTYWYFIDNLAYKLEKLADIYYKKSIGNVYVKEYRSFGINKNDRVLHIGCGAFPLTELTLAEKIGAKVVGIDINKKVIRSANNVIENKKLQDVIKIYNGNGINYPVNDFNVIIVSSCASPMINIADNIFKNSDTNTKIIIRELWTLTKPLIDFINSKKDIVLENEIKHNPFPFYGLFGWKSFLIKKL